MDKAALKRLGARAVVKLASDASQVVLGPIADQIAGEIRAQMRAGATSATRATAEFTKEVISGLLSALGGRENIREIEAIASSRLRIRVANGTAVDQNAIRSLGLRGIARPASDCVHEWVWLATPAFGGRTTKSA
jgi:PTS system N-acetylglucosamine-specific IIC component